MACGKYRDRCGDSRKDQDVVFMPYLYTCLYLLLEMIRSRPSTLSGEENKVFADRLMGRDSADRTLLRVKTRERFKVKMRVVLRAVSLV